MGRWSASVVLLVSIVVARGGAAQGVLDAHALERGVGPAVVFVRAYQGGGTSTEGTGVIIASNGWVVTNQHVLADSDDVEIWVPAVPEFARYEAIVVVADTERDLALLRIDGRDLRAAPLAPTATLRPGTAVASLGYPEGIFSANRRVRIVPGVVSHTRFPLGDLPERRWIVSDVRLREGNSGGPLVDGNGRVVGINTIRRLDGETSLSIPVDDVYGIVAGLLVIRERATAEFGDAVSDVERDLGWCRRVLATEPKGVGEVSRWLMARQLADAERLLGEATSAFMTDQWVRAWTLLRGAMQATQWLIGGFAAE